MSNQIEVKIDGKKLTPEKFIEAAKSFFDLIEGVSKNITNEPIKWGVQLDKGSAIIRAIDLNPTEASRRTTAAICKGVRSLRSGIRTIPPGFSKTEVSAARRLAAIIDGGDVKTVSIKNGGAPEDFIQSVVSTADAILSGEATTAFGSVEGIIDSMSVKHGFCCSIQDATYKREITCYFQKDDVAKEAKKGFEKRVMASGLIRYAREGHPTSISVNSIRIFPEESELPTIEEIQALFK